MWRTKLTELLGIDYPIIQGAMAISLNRSWFQLSAVPGLPALLPQADWIQIM